MSRRPLPQALLPISIAASLIAATLLSPLACARESGSAEVAPPADKARFHLYLLMGQSNMAGRGGLTPDKQKTSPRVLTLTQDGRWVVAKDPIHQKDGRTEPSVGPGISFALEMAKADPDVTIGLVPCAVGGTPLKRWVKGGDLYQRVLDRAKIASKSGVISGVLWHQGETDSDNKVFAERYGRSLAGMIRNLRKDLHEPQLPVVVGQLGTFLTARKHPHVSVVREAIKATAEADPFTGYADSAGLGHKGDQLHFSADAARELGERFASAMLALPREGGAIKVALVGDSTMCEYAANRPDRGWGMFLQEAFKPGTVEVTNQAKAGRSTKTFIQQKFWARTLAGRPDYVLIQFGHNDSHDPENPESTDAATDYRDYLRQYVRDCRSIGAKPVLITPMVRRTFHRDGTLDDILKPYAEAMKSVAAEMKVPLIDLHTASWQLIEPLGPDNAQRLANKRNDPTHFNEKGARAMLELVLADLPEAAPELADRLSPGPKKTSP